MVQASIGAAAVAGLFEGVSRTVQCFASYHCSNNTYPRAPQTTNATVHNNPTGTQRRAWRPSCPPRWRCRSAGRRGRPRPPRRRPLTGYASAVCNVCMYVCSMFYIQQAPSSVGHRLARPVCVPDMLLGIGKSSFDHSMIQQKPEDSFRDEIARVIFGDIGSIRDGANSRACNDVWMFSNSIRHICETPPCWTQIDWPWTHVSFRLLVRGGEQDPAARAHVHHGQVHLLLLQLLRL